MVNPFYQLQNLGSAFFQRARRRLWAFLGLLPIAGVAPPRRTGQAALRQPRRRVIHAYNAFGMALGSWRLSFQVPGGFTPNIPAGRLGKARPLKSSVW